MNQRTVFIFSLALLATAVYYAPFFLIVSDTPVKSDAVVLFLGGEKGTREKEANQLVTEGYADYLIVPAYRQVQKRTPDGKLIIIDLPLKLNTRDSGYLKLNHLELKTSAWLEDTHSETLTARDMMDSLGARSAILVSSSYHMRRIKLIAERVFAPPPLAKGGGGDFSSTGSNFRLTFIPTRYEAAGDGFWLFNSRDRRFVLTEYMKIGWFLLYSPFV